jgi:GT2 family glycosyltransferase
MNFSLIICTFKRPQALLTLLQSVKQQILYPNEILIIDGSPDAATEETLTQNSFLNLTYFKVEEKNRGLTNQRNYGIARVSATSEVVCFLDDDTVLAPDYFEQIMTTYKNYPNALGVGGYITNEVTWQYVGMEYESKINEFYYDGWKRIDGTRFILRKKLHIDADTKPGFLPEFSHGRSVGFLPPSNKTYEVEQLMGGVSSFKKKVFETFQFSQYFEGYGLYEDADFTLRVAKTGKLYLNTAAQLEHHHDAAGRPNQLAYGKMVVRNGWYVWRVKNPKPSFKTKLKWHAITIVLTCIRLTNIITTKNKKEAFTETIGRIIGWFSLFLSKPKITNRFDK